MKRNKKPRLKIVSGGQSGVDRAALDAGFPCGGWCPKRRLAEDGPIPKSYPLKESRSPFYSTRTRMNVEESDGTLIIVTAEPTGGTALTIDLAKNASKPLHVVKLNDKDVSAASLGKIRKWLKSNNINILNVAGPRESGAPGIYDKAKSLMKELLAQPFG